MRLEIHTTVAGVTLINDTYNSDPASMKGALDVLAKVGKGRRKIAILSEMLDLGLHSREEHLAVGKDVVRSEVDHLITVGENAALIGQTAALEGMSSRRIVNTRSNDEAAAEPFLLALGIVGGDVDHGGLHRVVLRVDGDDPGDALVVLRGGEGVADHVEGDAVLDRTARVVSLQLAQKTDSIRCIRM